VTPGLPATAAREPRDVLARSGSNFTIGFLCLDPARRAGMTAIYAFCRAADDAVDDAPDAATARAHLDFWRAELAAAAGGRAASPIGRALQQAMAAFAVPREPLEALLEGVATDVEPRGFGDEAELRAYCRRVASAVGLACLPVLGARGPAAERFADALGQALQLTNILRDLRGDREAGRCYVPRTWLQESGVDPAWLDGTGPASANTAAGPVARLCGRFAAAAQAEFARAAAELRTLPVPARRALVPARIMGAVYRDLLGRLRRRGPDLLAERVRVPKGRKVWLALLVLAGVRA